MSRLPAQQFMAFTIKHDGRANRITTAIKLSKAFKPEENPTPPFPLYDTTALWDTGATNSVVTQKTASEMGLVPTGATMVNHAGGTEQSTTYLVNVYLPNNVGIVGVTVTECKDIAGNFGAIIGMDIITAGDLSITNVNGKTWLTYRIPSIQTVDYVAEATRIRFSGVGRNDPCPCGKKDEKGNPIKFKHCHEKEVRATLRA